MRLKQRKKHYTHKLEVDLPPPPPPPKLPPQESPENEVSCYEHLSVKVVTRKLFKEDHEF